MEENTEKRKNKRRDKLASFSFQLTKSELERVDKVYHHFVKESSDDSISSKMMFMRLINRELSRIECKNV